MLRTLFFAAVASSLALCLPALSMAATLVADGEPRAVLVIPADAFSIETATAGEIQSHIKAMSGAELPIVTPDEATQHKGTVIRIGRAAPDALQAQLAKRTSDPSAFLLVVKGNEIAMTGLIDPAVIANDKAYRETKGARAQRAFDRMPLPEGTQFAGYELLEQLGVRWFIPGELGTHIPKAGTIELADQETLQVPSFSARGLQAIYADKWANRMRHGGLYFPPSHGLPGVPSHGAAGTALFAEHPEYFSLNNGVRTKRQVCISNPEVVTRISEAVRQWFRDNPYQTIIGLGANDGRGFCECENCKALDAGDYDAFGGYTSMTDRYIWLFNQILANIEDEFPDRRIGFYAYSVYNRPPLKVKPNSRIVPAVALITLCRTHGMNNHGCPEKQYEQWIIQEWGKLVPQVFDRGYWFNLADPGLPFFQVSRVASEIPLGYDLNIRGWRVESPYNWAGELPTRYIASKLMWNHEADVDALMKDFGEKFFGPTEEPMMKYITLMDTTRRDADYHTGSSWDVPNIYHASIRDQARKYLAAGKAAAPEGSIYADRVLLLTKSFAYLEAFIDMIESRNRHDFVASKEALDRLDALREDLLSYGRERINDPNPPMISRKAKEYMQRFFRRTTEDGYAKTTDGNRMIAAMGDVWEAQLDFDQIGDDVGWFKPENRGGNWQPLHTSTQSISNQGLRYFKGDIWYRQAVEIPAEAKGKKVFFWIGAVDEQAEVWVNGQNIGTFRGTFKPFDLDASAALQPGELNSVVVKVSNMTLNELGTGGLMGPAMFYIPADPNAEPTVQPPARDADTTLETIAG